MSSLPEKEVLVELRPLVVIVQHHLRVDERERDLVERRVDLPVRRHEIAHGKNTLPFFADLEIIEQHCRVRMRRPPHDGDAVGSRSEEHTSELQSHVNLVCRLLLEKKKKKNTRDSLSTKKTIIE